MKAVPVAYGRACGRCGQELHAPDPPHLCKDLQVRAKRQERYVRIVKDVLVQARLIEADVMFADRVAETIVKRLLNAGIEGEP